MFLLELLEVELELFAALQPGKWPVFGSIWMFDGLLQLFRELALLLLELDWVEFLLLPWKKELMFDLVCSIGPLELWMLSWFWTLEEGAPVRVSICMLIDLLLWYWVSVFGIPSGL